MTHLMADDGAPSSITISTRTNWGVEIYPDGSGSVIYGASDKGLFPKQSLAFVDILAKLRSLTRTKFDEKTRIGNVTFSLVYSDAANSFIIDEKDWPYVMELFKVALSKCANDKNRLEQIAKKSPFLPSIKPDHL